MNLYERLIAGEAGLSLVGLGYVGMPIAVAFAIAAFSGLCWLLTSMLGPNVTALTQFLGMS